MELRQLFSHSKPIGEILVESGYLTTSNLRQALFLQKRLRKNGKIVPLGRILLKKKLITPGQLQEARACHYNLHYFVDGEIKEKAAHYLEPEFCYAHKLIPLTVSEKIIHLLTSNPFDFKAFAEIGKQSKKTVKISVASKTELNRLLRDSFPERHKEMEIWKGVPLCTDKEYKPLGGVHERENLYVVQPLKNIELQILTNHEEELTEHLVSWHLLKAIAAGASDIHFEPAEGYLRIRHRVDGMLYDFAENPIVGERAQAAISRLKVMAKMSLDERQRPQDGRILLLNADAPEQRFDFRIASSPTINGEEIVMRLLDSRKLELGFDGLGIIGPAKKMIKESITNPYGIIIITGPTGSGKTTTLYTLLKELNHAYRKIMTIEDPVEYRIPGVVQHQIRDKVDFRFADAIRSFLRHDPDIILVGEIRDKETAEASIWAALTGHLVLTTLHTNDAASALTRLVQMGIEPFLLSSTVILVLSQRLVRKLCPACKIKKHYPREYLHKMGFALNDESPPEPTMELFTALETRFSSNTQETRCRKCKGIGYLDRIALMEAMKINEQIQDALAYGASAAELKKIALSSGMISMRDDGLTKAFHGFTSLQEVMSATIL